MTNHPNRGKKNERAVLVTTANRGVFFGYATKTGGPNKTAGRRALLRQVGCLRGFLWGGGPPGQAKNPPPPRRPFKTAQHHGRARSHQSRAEGVERATP